MTQGWGSFLPFIYVWPADRELCLHPGKTFSSLLWKCCDIFNSVMLFSDERPLDTFREGTVHSDSLVFVIVFTKFDRLLRNLKNTLRIFSSALTRPSSCNCLRSNRIRAFTFLLSYYENYPHTHASFDTICLNKMHVSNPVNVSSWQNTLMIYGITEPSPQCLFQWGAEVFTQLEHLHILSHCNLKCQCLLKVADNSTEERSQYN